jgi:ABC-type bacteriocin/lantibiotic exporter with double-glycine peptidase domain
MNTSIQCNNISFRFSSQRPYFFYNASFQLKLHSLYFVQGKNGVGKSTLFRILCGNTYLNEELQGSITVENKNYTAIHNNFPSSFTNTVKLVLQDVQAMVADQFTAYENLQLAQLKHFPTLTPLPNVAHAHALLENFGVPLHTPVYLLSGGQRQLLAIVMALQKPTRLLLLDEPTAALDPTNSALVMEHLQKLAHSLPLAILVISHDNELVATYSQGNIIQIKEEANHERSIAVQQATTK